MLTSVVAAAVLAASSAFAGNLQLRDPSSLLGQADVAQLRQAAANYPFDVRVLTSSDYADRAAFDRYVGAQVGSPNMVVVGLDPTHRRTSVHFGTGTRIAPTRFGAIESAGNAQFRTGDWRGGVQAILDSAQSAVGSGVAMTTPSANTNYYAPYGQSTTPYSAPYGSQPYAPQPQRQPQRHGFPGGLLLIALLIGGGVLFAMARRRRAMSQGGGGYANGPFGGAGPMGPYGGQPGYGPGYGGYMPRGGGLGGGMLGAGLGGLLGFGLGRATADHERHNDQGSGGFGPTGAGMGPSDPGAGGGFDAGGGTSDWGGGGGGGGGDAGGGGGSDW